MMAMVDDGLRLIDGEDDDLGEAEGPSLYVTIRRGLHGAPLDILHEASHLHSRLRSDELVYISAHDINEARVAAMVVVQEGFGRWDVRCMTGGWHRKNSPNSLPRLATWKAICMSACENSVEEVTCGSIYVDKINETGLHPFLGRDGSVYVSLYRQFLEAFHPATKALFFDGVGIENLVALPNTFKLPRRTK